MIINAYCWRYLLLRCYDDSLSIDIVFVNNQDNVMDSWKASSMVRQEKLDLRCLDDFCIIGIFSIIIIMDSNINYYLTDIFLFNYTFNLIR